VLQRLERLVANSIVSSAPAPRGANRSVKLEIAGDSTHVTDPSAEDQRRLIEALLARQAVASN